MSAYDELVGLISALSKDIDARPRIVDHNWDDAAEAIFNGRQITTDGVRQTWEVSRYRMLGDAYRTEARSKATVEALDQAAAAIRALEGERDDCDSETKRANQTAARLMIEKAEAEAARQSAEAKLEAVREAMTLAHHALLGRKPFGVPNGEEACEALAQALAELDKEKAGG